MEVITTNADATKELGKKVAANLTGGIIILLDGDLGSGKTTFTQGLAKELGVMSRVVSPTFILMRTYDIDYKKIKVLCHIDLYRLETCVDKELDNLGVGDYINSKEALILVEWADRAINYFPKESMKINFEYVDENIRKIILSQKIKI